MKKKGLVIGVVSAAVILLIIYFVNKPTLLGNIQQNHTEETTSISNFSFSSEKGDKIKFSFRSNIETGNLDIVLLDSNKNIVYELDKARELETFYTLEKTDSYTLQAQYTDFIGEYKITIYEVE